MLRSMLARAEALTECLVLATSLDVSSDGAANLLIDRNLVDSRDRLECFGLIKRQSRR